MEPCQRRTPGAQAKGRKGRGPGAAGRQGSGGALPAPNARSASEGPEGARSRRSREARLRWGLGSAERPERRRRAGRGAVPKKKCGQSGFWAIGWCLLTRRRLQHQGATFGLCPRADKVTLQWSVARPVARRRKPQGKGGWAWNTAGKSGRACLGGRGTRLPGGDERSEIVRWTISTKNAAPVARLVGRRGLI